MLQVDVLTDMASIEKLTPEWESLSRAAAPWTPFNSPLWCLTWWRHFQRSGWKARDHLNFYVLRNSEGTLVGICPMMVTHRPGSGALRTRELQFLGADSALTELRGPVCAAQDSAAIADALIARFNSSPPADWLQWRGLQDVDASPPGIELDASLDTIVYYLRLPYDWEVFKRNLPRNTKEALRKCYNSLARDRHTFDFRIVRQPCELPAALEIFFELHRSRSQKTGTIFHPDIFEEPRARNFYRAYCNELLRQDRLRIFQLVIRGEVVATRVGFICEDEVYLSFSGYADAWGKYSVMTTTIAEAIKWAIDNRLGTVNLSTGTDPSKTRWRPDSVAHTGGYTVSPGLISRLGFKAIKLARSHRKPDPALRARTSA